MLGGGYNLWQNPLNPQNRIVVAIPRNQTKLVSSPCITVRFFSVRTAISACTDQNSFPRSIKHPLRTVIHCTLLPATGLLLLSYCLLGATVADSVVVVSTPSSQGQPKSFGLDVDWPASYLSHHLLPRRLFALTAVSSSPSALLCLVCLVCLHSRESLLLL